jgi:hypothetical protein
MYLTSFIHREDLFEIAERWLCGRMEPDDGLRITQILISDGFVLGETLEMMLKLLLEMIYGNPLPLNRINVKGELRDAICRCAQGQNNRVRELVNLYKNNPEFFYREAPINGAICLDKHENLLGIYRIKRPRRIAEKANRYIANWIFGMVQNRAKRMAEERAKRSDIPLEKLITPKKRMDIEFIAAEGEIARQFKENSISLDKAALRIHDVGGIKVVADLDRLSQLVEKLADHPRIRVLEKQSFTGNYQAISSIIEVEWDLEQVCRSYEDKQAWEKYLHRGIPEAELRKGLAVLLERAKSTLNIELILSTFPDMVESELGNSLHEERIIEQRDTKHYKGYIPMNVEFLIEYLFAVGASPNVHIDRLPIKLWGRYLPDTVIDQIRALYRMPGSDLFC